MVISECLVSNDVHNLYATICWFSVVFQYTNILENCRELWYGLYMIDIIFFDEIPCMYSVW